jgi:hypothetical protein
LLDRGRRWRLLFRSGGGFYGWADLRFLTTQIGFVVGPTHYAPEHLYRTDDGGRSWRILRTGNAFCPTARHPGIRYQPKRRSRTLAQATEAGRRGARSAQHVRPALLSAHVERGGGDEDLVCALPSSAHFSDVGMLAIA